MLHPKFKKLLEKRKLSFEDAPGDVSSWADFLRAVDGLFNEVAARQQILENTLAVSTDEMEHLYERLKSKSESELRQSMQKFQTLFDSSPLPYLFFDHTGIIDCNLATVRLLEGKSKADILLKHPILFSPEFQSDGRGSLEKSIEMEKLARETGFHRFEWSNKTLLGKIFPVEVSLAPICLDGKDVLLVILRDLTQIKEKEQKLIESSKMSSLGEMAGGIAHEINNPLAIISGKANVLKGQVKAGNMDPAVFELELGKISSTVIRIAKIIKGLRSFSRNAEADSMELVPVSRIIEDTLELCRERFRNHSIELRVNSIDESIQLKCRPAQMCQVLLNLLGNSYDAIEQLSEKWIAIDVSTNQYFTIISVTDCGQGIPKDIVNKMMSPFFTTKEVGKGTGLGLSISKGIIEEHGGSFEYDHASKNTRFVIKLPIK